MQSAPFDKREQADKKKQEMAVANSDHLTLLNSYKVREMWTELGCCRRVGSDGSSTEHDLVECTVSKGSGDSCLGGVTLACSLTTSWYEGLSYLEPFIGAPSLLFV